MDIIEEIIFLDLNLLSLLLLKEGTSEHERKTLSISK